MSQGAYAGNQPVTARSLLVQTREGLELSVADVARHLKLSPAQVEALEAGAYDRLPGRVFVRGFLRNYAKLLGIDPQPLLRNMEREMPQPAVVDDATPVTEIVMPGGKKATWPLYAGLIALLIVGALAVYEFGFNDGTPASSSGEAAVAPSARAPDATAPMAASEPAAAAATPAKAQTAAVPSGVLPGASGERPPEVMAGASATTQLGAKTVRAGERELYFRFEQDSWVEIRDAKDKVIFSKLSRAGTEERVTAAPPLKLVVGNARGVRLTYGDKLVDLTPHSGATISRVTLE